MMLIQKRISLVAMLCLVTALSLRADVHTSTVNESIPDFDETGLSDTLAVTGYEVGETVASIDVSLQLSGDPLAF
jgi:hypothetical protein